jgi:hypothetical protein
VHTRAKSHNARPLLRFTKVKNGKKWVNPDELEEDWQPVLFGKIRLTELAAERKEKRRMRGNEDELEAYQVEDGSVW